MAGRQLLKGDVERHQLGERGRPPERRRIARREDVARRRIDDDRGLGRGPARDGCGPTAASSRRAQARSRRNTRVMSAEGTVSGAKGSASSWAVDHIRYVETPCPWFEPAARLAACQYRGLIGCAGQSLKHGRRARDQDTTYVAFDTSKETLAAVAIVLDRLDLRPLFIARRSRRRALEAGEGARVSSRRGQVARQQRSPGWPLRASLKERPRPGACRPASCRRRWRG